jgi:hypothetical protein
MNKIINNKTEKETGIQKQRLRDKAKYTDFISNNNNNAARYVQHIPKVYE